VRFVRTADHTPLFSFSLKTLGFARTRYPGVYEMNVSTSLQPNEQVVGFGQHQVPTLSMRGRCFDMAPQNTEILIPLVHSNDVGWSYLLNAPGYGNVCVDAASNGRATANSVQWAVRGAEQLDMWVVASPPRVAGAASHLANALSAYHAVTGPPLPLPEWTSGFWTSKNR
jgi:alpha-glucosidase (family GH31 glycosyl hydrolase)